MEFTATGNKFDTRIQRTPLPNVSIAGHIPMGHRSYGETKWGTNRVRRDGRSSSPIQELSPSDRQTGTGRENWGNAGEAGSGYRFRDDYGHIYAKDANAEQGGDSDEEGESADRERGRTRFRASPAQMGLDNEYGQNGTIVEYALADQDEREQEDSNSLRILFPEQFMSPPIPRANRTGFLAPSLESSMSPNIPAAGIQNDHKTKNTPIQTTLNRSPSVMRIASVTNVNSNSRVAARDNNSFSQSPAGTQGQGGLHTPSGRRIAGIIEYAVVETHGQRKATSVGGLNIMGRPLKSNQFGFQPVLDESDDESPVTSHHGLPQYHQTAPFYPVTPNGQKSYDPDHRRPQVNQRQGYSVSKPVMPPLPQTVFDLDDIVTFASEFFGDVDVAKLQIGVKRSRVNKYETMESFIKEYKSARFGVARNGDVKEGHVVAKTRYDESRAAIRERDDMIAYRDEQLRKWNETDTIAERDRTIFFQAEQLRQLRGHAAGMKKVILKLRGESADEMQVQVKGVAQSSGQGSEHEGEGVGAEVGDPTLEIAMEETTGQNEVENGMETDI